MARHERSAGVIVYSLFPAAPDAATSLHFLLLNYGKHWDFPKGHLEAGESDFDAARRELQEETGLTDVSFVPGFHHEISYFFRHKSYGLVRKTVAFFLAKTDTQTIALSSEHQGYVFLPLAEAIQRVTFPTAKQVLKVAAQRLALIP